MNRERALQIIAAGPRPMHLRYSVRLMHSSQGHKWVRIHAPKSGELVGRCEVVEIEPLFAFRCALPHKPKHRVRRIWPAHHRIIDGQQVRMR